MAIIFKMVDNDGFIVLEDEAKRELSSLMVCATIRRKLFHAKYVDGSKTPYAGYIEGGNDNIYYMAEDWVAINKKHYKIYSDEFVDEQIDI